MRKIKLLGLSALLLFIMSGCLKKGLPEFENWDSNNLSNVYVEHRYEGAKILNGQPVVEYIRLTVGKTVDESKNSVDLKIEVPPASGNFTSVIREKVLQNKLWMYVDIPTAAKITPIGDTPKLGDVADLTKELTYRITAANGDTKDWTIKVSSFKK